MILIKISKLSYFINCIQTNINDLENTWKGVKKLKYPEGTWSSVPCTVIKSNTTLTNPQKLLMGPLIISQAYQTKIKLNILIWF